MKTSLILLFNLFLISVLCQNTPINFEPNGNGLNWTWTTFENDYNPPVEIVTNPDMSGINTSSAVAKFTAVQAGNPWAGFESLHGSDIGSFSLDITNCTIKIMVWKSVISDVGIKFVDATSAAQPEIKVANTLVNRWEELTFDFSSRIGVYPFVKDQIVIFPDFDLAGRSQDNIIYIDNVYDLNNGTNSIIKENKFSIQVFPNPSSDLITVTINQELINDQYILTDQLGKIVEKGILTDLSNTLDIASYKQGLYFIQIGENKEPLKIVKN